MAIIVLMRKIVKIVGHLKPELLNVLQTHDFDARHQIVAPALILLFLVSGCLQNPCKDKPIVFYETSDNLYLQGCMDKKWNGSYVFTILKSDVTEEEKLAIAGWPKV